MVSTTKNLSLLWLFLIFAIIPSVNQFPFIAQAPELVKATLYLYLLKAAVIIIILYFFQKVRPLIPDLPLLLPLLIWIIIILLSLIWSVDPHKSFFGNYYRQDGIITFLHLLILPAVMHFFTPRILKFAAFTIGIGCLFVSIFSNFSLLNFIINTHDIRALSQFSFSPTHGLPNFAAGYLVVSFPFLIYLLSAFPLNSLIKTVLILLPISAIIFTQSRGGLVGLFIMGLCYFFTQGRNQVLRTIVAGLAMIFLTLLIIKIYSARPQWYQPESRARIVTTLAMSAAHKPFGWGWANVDRAFSLQDWPVPRNDDVYVDKAHSHWLEMLITIGVPGLVAYLILQANMAWSFYNQRHDQLMRTAFISLAIFIIHSQTNVISISEEIIFSFLIGLALVRFFPSNPISTR